MRWPWQHKWDWVASSSWSDSNRQNSLCVFVPFRFTPRTLSARNSFSYHDVPTQPPTWRLFSNTWIPTPGNVPAHHCGSIGGGAFPKWITIVSSAQHNLAFYLPMSVWDPPLQSNQTSIFWTEANHINREVPKELQQSSQNVQMFYSNMKQHIFLLTNLTTILTTMTTTRSTMNGPLRLLWLPTTATL